MSSSSGGIRSPAMSCNAMGGQHRLALKKRLLVRGARGEVGRGEPAHQAAEAGAVACVLMKCHKEIGVGRLDYGSSAIHFRNFMHAQTLWGPGKRRGTVLHRGGVSEKRDILRGFKVCCIRQQVSRRGEPAVPSLLPSDAVEACDAQVLANFMNLIAPIRERAFHF